MRIAVALIPCLLLALPVLFPVVSGADIIPQGMKPVSVCATIDNLDEFPDIALVAVVTFGEEERERYVVESGKCLTKGYKFNRLMIYAISRADLKTVGLENVLPGTDPLVLEAENVPEVRERLEDEDSKTVRVNELWRIAGFSENHIILYKSSVTKECSGLFDVDKTESADPPDVDNLRQTLAP